MMNTKKLLIYLLIAAFPFACMQVASAGNCDNPRYASKNKDECDPGSEPPGVEKVLEITVYFGEDSSDGDPENCVEPYCTSTTFTAVGSVICGSQVCDFNGLVTPGTQTVFNIPPSIFNLLAMTEIRGTAIEPEGCFDIAAGGVPSSPPDGTLANQYTAKGSTKSGVSYLDDSGVNRELTYEVSLRSPVVAGPDQKWHASVSAVSTDMGNEPQNYKFHFGGNCDSHIGQCPTLSGSDLSAFNGFFEEGGGGGIFGTNTNRRGEPQTCRCTVSSKPGCPSSVDMGSLPRPASRIHIKDVTPTT